MREAANRYLVYPEVDCETLYFYDEPMYDATFGMRRIGVRATRKPPGHIVTYDNDAWGTTPDSLQWTVPADADIHQFLFDRLEQLNWPKRP